MKAPEASTLTGAVTMSGSGNGFTSALTTISGALTVARCHDLAAERRRSQARRSSVASGGALTITGAPSAIGAILSVSGGGSLTANGLTTSSGSRLTVDGATSGGEPHVDHERRQRFRFRRPAVAAEPARRNVDDLQRHQQALLLEQSIGSSGTGSQVTLSNLATLTVTTEACSPSGQRAVRA